jgi:hypothetical protein
MEGRFMSSILCPKDKKSCVSAEITQPIIVKGFGSEPKRLGLKNVKNFSVLAIGENGNTEIELKTKYVYQYDEKTYQKLRNAYELNDKEALEKLWQQAKPIS